ncbi:hypothetical protein SRHO_G00156580 [Serrasalmus rhombeus]
MDLVKGALDGQAEKVIDQAANVAKQTVNSMIGGEKKEKKQAGGIGNMVSGAINKAASEAAADKATEQVCDFGKKLFG